MSATEEVRALLDARGVEWMGTDYSEPTDGHATNTSLGHEHHDAVFAEYVGGTVLRLFDLTPEQAIAATLGPCSCPNDCTNGERTETCHDLAVTPAYSDKTKFECSECGYEYSAVGGFGCDYGDEPDFNYCPNCGRRVEQ